MAAGCAVRPSRRSELRRGVTTPAARARLIIERKYRHPRQKSLARGAFLGVAGNRILTEPHPEKSPLRGKTSVSSFESRPSKATRFAKICFPSARVGLAAGNFALSRPSAQASSLQNVDLNDWRKSTGDNDCGPRNGDVIAVVAFSSLRSTKLLFFLSRHSSSRRLVRNERACTWKGPSGRVEPQGRFVGEPTSESARPFGSRAQRRTARRRASIVGVFSSPESLGPPRRLLSPSADEAHEAYNHGRAPAGAPQHG